MKRALAIVLLAACGEPPSSGGGGDGGGGGADARPGGDGGAGTFRDCRGAAFTPAPAESWRHDTQTPIIVASGSPNHSGQDVLTTGGPASLPGKFSYGTFGKDLEDEDVRVWLWDCSTWQELGDFTTDRDGRLAAPLAATPGIGVFEVRFEVLGDQSQVSSFLWVVPAGTRLIVTDIDGTMTQSDRELFEQMYDGSHVPVPYPGAVDLTLAHRERGYLVFYLTGRPYWLTRHTRDWLRDLGFSPGPLRVTDSESQSVPSESGVGDFKKGVLTAHQTSFDFDFAYGNATTDIYGYLGAGFPPEDVWIIGDHGGEQGTHAVDGTWVPRVTEVRALPSVAQPFSW
jgi:hypothetical protein